MNHCLLFSVTDKGLARSLGVYRIAHHLRTEGWDAEVIDWAMRWQLDELKQLVRSRVTADTKFFGFSHMFSLWNDTLEEFCKWLKDTYPDIVLISGSGVHPQFESKHFDYYIQGFGENALIVLLKWLYGNGTRPWFSLEKYQGKNIIAANERYPAFPMKSLMVKYEDRDFIQPGEWLTVEFARGCKFACDFCNFPVLGVKGDYSRDADDFREQLVDAYDRFGITNYLVSDETFNDRTEKITKFADVVETLPFDPWFSGFIRADLLISRPKDKEELLRMNFLGHHYGVESFNHTAAKAVGKGMHPDRIKQGVVDIRNYFETHGRKLYRGTMSFIIGLPGETIPEIENTLEWLKGNWRGQSIVPFVLEIPVGELDQLSKMSLNYKQYGYREMSNTALIERSNSHVQVAKDLLVWENDHMNVYQAHELHKKLYKEMYDSGNDFRPAIWELSFLGPEHDLLERLSITQSEIYKYNKIEYNVKRYIDKKLSI
jgi:radical SAM superfamily enzyme YgiQ (UPF0313 family)